MISLPGCTFKCGVLGARIAIWLARLGAGLPLDLLALEAHGFGLHHAGQHSDIVELADGVVEAQPGRGGA